MPRVGKAQGSGMARLKDIRITGQRKKPPKKMKKQEKVGRNRRNG